jgi:hypothetical protein
MTSDQMTAAEAERRFDSVMICGGTPEERRFALKRWMDAYRREWYTKRSAPPDQAKRAAAKAIR